MWLRRGLDDCFVGPGFTCRTAKFGAERLRARWRPGAASFYAFADRRPGLPSSLATRGHFYAAERPKPQSMRHAVDGIAS